MRDRKSDVTGLPHKNSFFQKLSEAQEISSSKTCDLVLITYDFYGKILLPPAVSPWDFVTPYSWALLGILVPVYLSSAGVISANKPLERHRFYASSWRK